MRICENMSEIKVSIIIPVYNVEKYLEECLQSCLNQSLSDTEIICIDDGSNDKSLEILEDYTQKYDNIIVFSQTNQGAGKARNIGIQNAKGKYIFFLDADDFFFSNYVLEKLYNTAERENVLMCGGNLVYFQNGIMYGNENSTFKEEGMHFSEEIDTCYFYTRFLYSSTLIKENKLFFSDYRRFQDPPFLVKAIANSKQFYTITDSVYSYRISHKQVIYTAEKMIDCLKGIKEVLEVAIENNLEKVYKVQLRRVLQDLKMHICGYIYKKEYSVLNLLKEMNAIYYQATKADEENIIWNEKVAETYISECKNIAHKLHQYKNEKKNLIIYGAGGYGKFVLDWLNNFQYENIIGFAVTKTNEDNKMLGYDIKEIREYLPQYQEAIIVVAVSERYQHDIREYLKSFNLKNIIFMCDLTKLRFIEEFL